MNKYFDLVPELLITPVQLLLQTFDLYPEPLFVHLGDLLSLFDLLALVARAAPTLLPLLGRHDSRPVLQ